MEKKVDEVPQEEKAYIIKEEARDLKPRKALRKTMLENKTPLPLAALESLQTKNAETKKKPRFSLTLTPEEIEEDILLMTGSKPSKKPQKRAESVRNELDKLFPGMQFLSGNPDACHSGGTSPSSSSFSNDVGVEKKSDSSGK